MDWLLLAGGGILLYFGAEWFVGGASALALSLRVAKIFVGLTVVAYGTSAPEVIVGVEAASAGHGAVAIANVIGSNVANIGLILGIAALIQPARVDGALRRRELPVLIVSTASLPFLLADGEVSRLEGGFLLFVAVAYTAWMVRSARASMVAAARTVATAASEAADAAGAPAPGGRVRAAVTALFGLITLLVGGRLFIDGAVQVARSIGMSERLVGLTIVAIGTSLPELVTSAIAASKGHSDLAVGNVLGSNIFNVFLCLGAAACVAPIGVPLSNLLPELSALVVMTVICVAFIRTERTISRVEGGLALALYGLFISLTISRG